LKLTACPNYNASNYPEKETGPMKYAPVFLFALVLLTFTPSGSSADDSLSQKLEKKYFDTLDNWVSRGGPKDEIQETVIGTCGKLVMTTVDAVEKAKLTTTEREEFHFRVDVCSKMTVNRVYPQSQLQNPDTVRMICDEGSVEVFKKLCKRSGLR
jgi:hypothetical protein